MYIKHRFKSKLKRSFIYITNTTNPTFPYVVNIRNNNNDGIGLDASEGAEEEGLLDPIHPFISLHLIPFTTPSTPSTPSLSSSTHPQRLPTPLSPNPTSPSEKNPTTRSPSIGETVIGFSGGERRYGSGVGVRG